MIKKFRQHMVERAYRNALALYADKPLVQLTEKLPFYQLLDDYKKEGTRRALVYLIELKRQAIAALLCYDTDGDPHAVSKRLFEKDVASIGISEAVKYWQHRTNPNDFWRWVGGVPKWQPDYEYRRF